METASLVDPYFIFQNVELIVQRKPRKSFSRPSSRCSEPRFLFTLNTGFVDLLISVSILCKRKRVLLLGRVFCEFWACLNRLEIKSRIMIKSKTA